MGKGDTRRPQAITDTEMGTRWAKTFRYRAYKIYQYPKKAYWRVYDHQENKVQSEHFGVGMEIVAKQTADDLNAGRAK